MDLPVRKKLPHTIPQWVADGSWFFITIKCVPPEKISCAVAASVTRCCQVCLALPPVPAHTGSFARHLRVSARTGNGNEDQELEEVCGRKARRRLATRLFDHRLRDHHELDEKTSYILLNPVRKRLCERAEDWVWIYRPNDRPPPRLG